MSTFNLSTVCEPVSLPPLPESLEYLNLIGEGCTTGTASISIAGMPDTLYSMILWNILNVQWPVTSYIDYLEITLGSDGSSFSMPTVHVGNMNLNLYGPDPWQLDLSAVDCANVGLEINDSGNAGILWPITMEELTVGEYVYGSIGIMPPSLQSLTIYSGSICVPYLPEGLTLLYVNNSIECIPNWPASLLSCTCPGGNTPETVTYCSVLNIDCPGIYPGIAGHVVIDTNANGQYDAGEPPLPQSIITIQPGGNTVGCNDLGYWETAVQPGSYTMSPSSNYPYIASIAPTQHTASLPNMGDSDIDNDFAVVLMPNIQDLRVNLYAEPARPGFDNRLYLSCLNYGTIPMNAAVTLTFDGDQTWVGSSSIPDLQNATTATWNLNDIAIGETRHITVDLNTAASVPLGNSIFHTLVADPVATDETPSDNTYTVTDSVVGSYDPNDKLLTPKVLSPAVVVQGETSLEYTIRFQNTGTYPAERVLILDTLSADLQWESMRFIASSHPNHWYITDGVLHVFHDAIMLPDSTSDEPNSHGFFSFSMLPATDLQDGATVTNIAHIVFDFNEPIITPPAVFSVDVLAGITSTEKLQAFQLVPNPAHDRIQIRLESNALVQYRVNDELGRVVINGTVTPNGWVDLHALSAGPYLLDVLHNESWTSQQFMKQ